MSLTPPDTATARACGTCNICCKVYTIRALDKPEGKWCRHCEIGKGCRIYDARPAECRDFVCLWMRDPTIPDNWKPELSKLSLSVHPVTGFIHVQVDPGFPQAWRREPYFSGLKAWSERLLAAKRHLMIFVGARATLMMPTGPVEVGAMSPDANFLVKERYGASGKTYEIERLDPPPPRPAREGVLKTP